MTTLTAQESGWIHEVAGRLRLIQSDTAQVEPGKRAEFLQEEVERSLKTVPPANRKRFVEALLARFPVAGKVVSTFSPTATAPVVAPMPVPVAESPAETLERFLAVVPKLSEEQRGELVQRLVGSELLRAYRSSLVLETSEESQRALGLLTGQQPRLERMVQLTVMLLDVISRLDQTGLKTMEALAPRSPLLKRNESVRKAAARFLVGEVETVEPQMREAFGLLAALLMATLVPGKADQSPPDKRHLVPETFSYFYHERFPPAAIEEIVAAEGRVGFLGNKKEQCWNRYCELARDLATTDLVDRKIKQCLAAVVQKFVEKNAGGGR